MEGDGSPPPGQDEAFLHSAWARLTSQYGSPKVGLLVLRRVLEVPPEVTKEEDIVNLVQDISQARTVATELGLPVTGSVASAVQKRAFITDMKEKLHLLLSSTPPRNDQSPPRAPRSPAEE